VICDRCGLDKTATVVRSAAIVRVHPGTGKETTEVRTSRLCVGCGGGDAPEQLRAIAQRRASDS
jgi:hypothetical protein